MCCGRMRQPHHGEPADRPAVARLSVELTTAAEHVQFGTARQPLAECLRALPGPGTPVQLPAELPGFDLARMCPGAGKAVAEPSSPRRFEQSSYI